MSGKKNVINRMIDILIIDNGKSYEKYDGLNENSKISHIYRGDVNHEKHLRHSYSKPFTLQISLCICNSRLSLWCNLLHITSNCGVLPIFISAKSRPSHDQHDFIKKNVTSTIAFGCPIIALCKGRHLTLWNSFSLSLCYGG